MLRTDRDPATVVDDVEAAMDSHMAAGHPGRRLSHLPSLRTSRKLSGTSG